MIGLQYHTHVKHFLETVFSVALLIFCHLEVVEIRFSCHNSGHYPSSRPLFKPEGFGDWILSLSSGGTYAFGFSVFGNRG
jgi:hypothetical protein